jgi:hypothetical protein
VNETALQRRRHVKLWLFKRHPESFMRLGAHTPELQQEQKMLE